MSETITYTIYTEYLRAKATLQRAQFLQGQTRRESVHEFCLQLGINEDKFISEFTEWLGNTPLNWEQGLELCRHCVFEKGIPLPWIVEQGFLAAKNSSTDN